MTDPMLEGRFVCGITVGRTSLSPRLINGPFNALTVPKMPTSFRRCPP